MNSPHLYSLTDRPRHEWHVREFATAEMQLALMEVGFPNIGLYGQKQRRLVRQPVLKAMYGLLGTYLLPGHFSAEVLPLRSGLEARYSVFVSRPPAPV